jgi:uncharacterized protein YybS (DUF2232 family)
MSRSARVGLAAAVSSGLYAAALWLAPVTTPLVMFVPLPALILATREDATMCGLWFALSTSAIAIEFGTPAAVGFVLPLAFPSMVVAFGIRRFWTFERTAMAGIIAWCLGIAGVLLLAFGSVEAVITSAREQLMRSFDLVVSTSGSIGASASAVAAVEAERGVLVAALLELLPALVVLTGALTIIGNLVLLRSWTGVSRNVNLRLWRTPEPLIWALILTGFGMFIPAYSVAAAARNVFVVLLGCYFCQGLAIVSYYLDRFRLPRGIRAVGYLLIAVQHVVAAMVLALGVFDLWGNFRRLGADGPADIPLNSDGE